MKRILLALALVLGFSVPAHAQRGGGRGFGGARGGFSRGVGGFRGGFGRGPVIVNNGFGFGFGSPFISNGFIGSPFINNGFGPVFVQPGFTVIRRGGFGGFGGRFGRR